MLAFSGLRLCSTLWLALIGMEIRPYRSLISFKRLRRKGVTKGDALVPRYRARSMDFFCQTPLYQIFVPPFGWHDWNGNQTMSILDFIRTVETQGRH